MLLPCSDEEVAGPDALQFYPEPRHLRSSRSGSSTSILHGGYVVRYVGDFSTVVSLDLQQLDKLHALGEDRWEAELGAGVTSGPERRTTAQSSAAISLAASRSASRLATIGGYATTP